MASLGFTEPGFYLTLYFLVRRSLRHETNGRVFTFVLLLCLPTTIAQICINVINPNIQSQKEGYGGKIPKYFTAAILEEGNMAFCTYPLLSIIVHGVFVSLFVSYFLYVGLKIISLAINKSLERRVWAMILAVVLFLPLRVILVLRPIADSLAVHWIFESSEFRTRQQQLNIIPMEPFVRPLSGFVSDNDDDFSVVASQSLLESAV